MLTLVFFVLSTPLIFRFWLAPALIAWFPSIPGVVVAAGSLSRYGRGTLESPTAMFLVAVGFLASGLNLTAQVSWIVMLYVRI